MKGGAVPYCIFFLPHLQDEKPLAFVAWTVWTGPHSWSIGAFQMSEGARRILCGRAFSQPSARLQATIPEVRPYCLLFALFASSPPRIHTGAVSGCKGQLRHTTAGHTPSPSLLPGRRTHCARGIDRPRLPVAH